MISDNVYELCFKRRFKEFYYLGIWAVVSLLLEGIIFIATTPIKEINDYSVSFFMILTAVSTLSWGILMYLEEHSIKSAQKKEKINTPLCYPICGCSQSAQILKDWWKLDDLEHKMNHINTKRILWTIYGLTCGFIKFALLLFVKDLSYQWAYMMIYIGLAILSSIDILVRFIKCKKIKSKKSLLFPEIQNLFPEESINDAFLRKERARSAVIFTELFID